MSKLGRRVRRGLLHDSVFLFVNLKLSVGSYLFDVCRFRSFTELIFLHCMQALFHCTRGQNVNTASAHSVYVVCLLLLALGCVGCLFGLAPHKDSVNLHVGFFFLVIFSHGHSSVHCCINVCFIVVLMCSSL